MHGTVWCLHGAVGMAADWSGFTLPGRAVKRVDLWRFLDCCPMSLDDFGAALNREAEAVPGPHVLVGYSMGGRLALHALRAGGPWAAAVIVSAHPGLEDEAERAERRARDAERAALALRGDWRDFLAKWNAQDVLATSPHGTRRMADRGGLAGRRREVARSFIDWSLGAQAPLWADLPVIDPPVLWLAGGRDEKFRLLGARAAARLPHAEFATFPDAGHRLPWEEPERFRETVRLFLERSVRG